KRFSALFQGADAVAQTGRLLIVFLGDRLLEAVAQLDQLRLRFLVLRQPARRLAPGAPLARGVLPKRSPLLPKFLVVVGAAQAAGVAELRELHAAQRALVLVEQPFLDLAGLLRRGPRLGAALLRLVQVLVGALLTQMELFKLFVGKNFGDVQ